MRAKVNFTNRFKQPLLIKYSRIWEIQEEINLPATWDESVYQEELNKKVT